MSQVDLGFQLENRLLLLTGIPLKEISILSKEYQHMRPQDNTNQLIEVYFMKIPFLVT